jgi:type II secretion system protein G
MQVRLQKEKEIRSNKGFTLIELLVVISIIGLLSSVVLASLQDVRQKAKNSKTVQDVMQLRTALELYNSDYGKYPGEEDDIIASPYHHSLNLPNLNWVNKTFDFKEYMEPRLSPKYISSVSEPSKPPTANNPLYYYLSMDIPAYGYSAGDDVYRKYDDGNGYWYCPCCVVIKNLDIIFLNFILIKI